MPLLSLPTPSAHSAPGKGQGAADISQQLLSVTSIPHRFFLLQALSFQMPQFPEEMITGPIMESFPTLESNVCFAFWNLSFFSNLGFCRVLSPYFSVSLCSLLLSPCGAFCPFLHVFPKVPHLELTGSVMSLCLLQRQ